MLLAGSTTSPHSRLHGLSLSHNESEQHRQCDGAEPHKHPCADRRSLLSDHRDKYGQFHTREVGSRIPLWSPSLAMTMEGVSHQFAGGIQMLVVVPIPHGSSVEPPQAAYRLYARGYPSVEVFSCNRCRQGQGRTVTRRRGRQYLVYPWSASPQRRIAAPTAGPHTTTT
jgi:hypothetical protein